MVLCVCMSLYVFMCVYVCLCVYVFMCVCVLVCVWVGGYMGGCPEPEPDPKMITEPSP